MRASRASRVCPSLTQVLQLPIFARLSFCIVEVGAEMLRMMKMWSFKEGQEAPAVGVAGGMSGGDGEAKNAGQQQVVAQLR